MACNRCGEGINDRREVTVKSQTLCKACANEAYYQPLQTTDDPILDGSPPVVAVVGYSDSGKTRVAAALIELLSARGYRIAAIKHCLHGHQPARPHSDSERLYERGAVAVIASSPDKPWWKE